MHWRVSRGAHFDMALMGKGDSKVGRNELACKNQTRGTHTCDPGRLVIKLYCIRQNIHMRAVFLLSPMLDYIDQQENRNFKAIDKYRNHQYFMHILHEH